MKFGAIKSGILHLLGKTPLAKVLIYPDPTPPPKSLLAVAITLELEPEELEALAFALQVSLGGHTLDPDQFRAVKEIVGKIARQVDRDTRDRLTAATSYAIERAHRRCREDLFLAAQTPSVN